MLKIITCVIFAWTATSTYAHGISEADKLAMIKGGNLEYIKQGAIHMITGYDHLLFLFGVIFFLTKFKDIVKFITAFTIGHSITLILATFMQITANYLLVDAVIALTVFYKGFDNVGGFKKFLNMNSPNLVKVVFFIGLIHGFGLSTRLQDFDLGSQGLLLKIISFNIGVELGQIAALAIFLVFLRIWHKYPSFNKFSILSNVGIMFAGVMLFFMQVHDYTHQKTAWPDDQWKDIQTITVPAGKGLEYKFQVNKDDPLKYEWKTDGGKLYYDFHGEPKGAAKDVFESFEIKTQNQAYGLLLAPFQGVHGWYWKNKTTKPVTITLKTNGIYQILGIK